MTKNIWDRLENLQKICQPMKEPLLGNPQTTSTYFNHMGTLTMVKTGAEGNVDQPRVLKIAFGGVVSAFSHHLVGTFLVSL